MVSAERVRDELVKLLLARSPRERAGPARRHRPGRRSFLPELPALRLEVDEHHRHKDVYEHSLTVLEQAIALEGPRRVPGVRSARSAARPRPAAGGAAARHRQARDPPLRARRGRHLPPPRAGRRQARRPSGSRRCATTRRRSRPSPAWSSCTCASTATATGSGPTRRCGATSPTPGRCWPGCTCSPASDSTTRNPRKAAAPVPGLRRPRGAHRARCSSRRSWPRCGPSSTGTRSASCSACRRAGSSGEAYRFLLALRLDEGVLGQDVAAQRLRDWYAARGD